MSSRDFMLNADETGRFVTPSSHPTPLSSRRLVLATDLDGTFLGGSDADRRALYDWIEANRATVGVIFVSGRDPQFIGQLCGSGEVPWPDFVIGDVGTTIAAISGRGEIAPIAPLEEEIARRWNNSTPKVRALLDGRPGLRPQPTDFRYRMSFDMDPALLDPYAEAAVTALGLDVLISDNRFFDVLPPGISKGPSLDRLIRHLGVAHARVLAAGDTLNDLSMLTLGVPAVAVGGAERRLLDAVADLPHLHVAEGIGAAGITEAISAFALH